MAGKIPQPRSYQSILGDMIDSFLSRYGLRGLRIGGPLLSILEAASQSDVRSSQDVFNLLDAASSDRATGIALDRRAADEDLQRLPVTASSGTVTFYDTSFAKVSTKVYPGSSAPNAGSLSIRVSDATTFPDTGQIYLGRGTTNYEGPLTYTSKTKLPNSTYWTLTLAAPTQKFHDVNESVILAQGGPRVVPAGTIVQTSQNNVADAVTFATVFAATIPDGETEVEGVDVICQQPGVIGNVPYEAITEFQSSPFVGASVTNPLPFDNGLAVESDEALRERIKSARQSRSRGTALALITNTKGVRSPDENKTVIAATVVNANPTTLFIDDGTGYEESVEGVALETVVDQSLGGQQYFRLTRTPVTKAFAETTLTAPFELQAGSRLAVNVAGVLSEHSFSASEFRSISNATAYEVVAALNGNPSLLFSARTSHNGTRVVLFARQDTDEDIEIVAPDEEGIDANTFLGFPAGINYTLRLYRDDQLLYKDGRSAYVLSAPQSMWKQTIANGCYFKIQVDGTKAVTYKITNQDFVDAGTGYTTVSALNSLESWASVLNYKIPGISATVTSGRIQLASNRGPSFRAAVVVSEPLSTDKDSEGNVVTDHTFNLVELGLFSAESAYGRNNDYALNRNTGELKLTIPLASGQALTAGTLYTRAYIQSGEHASATVTTTEDSRLWVVVDGAASMIQTGINAGVSLTMSQTNGIRYTAAPAGTYFSNLRIGDWAIVWDPAVSAHGAWRISDVDAGGNWFQVDRPVTGLQAGVAPIANGVVFVRTSAPLQELRIPAGTNQSLATIAASLTSQLRGATASVFRNKYLRITTDSFGTDGDVFVATFDLEAAKLKLPVGKLVSNTDSHLAVVESQNSELGTTEFVIGNVSVLESGGRFNATGITPHSGNLIAFSHRLSPTSYGRLANQHFPLRSTGGSLTLRHGFPILTIPTGGLVRSSNVVTATTTTPHNYKTGDIVYVGSAGAPDANFLPGYKTCVVTGATTFTYAESGSTATSATQYSVLPDIGILLDDRVWLSTAYAIGPQDTLSVVLDNDATAKSYNIPMWRTVTPAPGATYNATALPVVDADNGGAPLSTAFTSNDPDFFQDFALYMRARTKTHDNTASKSILWRYSRMGPEGNVVRVSYVYPAQPNQPLAMKTRSGQFSDLYVTLPSGAERTGLGLTNTSKFTITTASGVNAYGVAYTDATFAFAKPSVTLDRAGDGVTVTATSSSSHGFAVGDIVYITSNDSNFGSGAKTVTFVFSNSFMYVETGPASVTATGQTACSSPTDFNTASIQIGDVVSILSSTGFPAWTIGAWRVRSKTSTSFTVRFAGSGGAITNPNGVNNVVGLKFFPVNTATSTATQIAAWSATTGLVSGVVLGDGTGIVDRSTIDEYLDGVLNSTAAAPVSAWQFLDGVNYVDTSNLGVTPNTLKLKSQVSASLTTNADFENEQMRLVPVTADAVARYLNSPAVSGFYAGSRVDVSPGSTLQISSRTPGSKGAVQVTGGTANGGGAAIIGACSVVDGTYSKVMVASSQTQSLLGKHWVAVQAHVQQQKTVPVPPSTQVSVSANGVNWNVNFNGVSLWTKRQTLNDVTDQWMIWKQGRFACFYLIDNGTTNPLSSSILEGDWVVARLSGASARNNGTFRVVARSGNAFWVENDSAVEEYVPMLSGDSIVFYSEDSVMPGDKLIIDSNVLGEKNRGAFTVLDTSVNASTVTVSGDMVAAVATLNDQSDFFRFIEAEPLRLIKKVHTICANPTTGFTDVVFTTNGLATKMSSVGAAVVQPLDKFAFPTSLVTGADGYHYSKGLIGEVNKVIYGDASNPSVYPGVVAAGANVNISGPLVKRIQVGIAIRIRTGGASEEIVDRVKSAVASTINRTELGKPVAISSIVSAAAGVDGVVAVTILSPTYTSSSDLIPVQAEEKPRVLNVDQDILVSIVGQ
ncbi:baseplate protein J-like protein [Myxococcus phage Mx1]|nr:baseplate protein J-like protein [Myxococcus phage Mx1]